MGWQQNYYTVRNPEKYDGDVNNVFYRSSWELEAFLFCDGNPNVIKWSSEEIVIPYSMPTANGGVRPAKYYPDLYMEFIRDSDGKTCRELIEIKPAKQAKPSRSKNPKTKMFENQAYMKNQLKWEAARGWCMQHGITFRVLTEKEQFN
jgi:hypothetical protein|tara:strand:- start:118 stop:561 length:444 start_codon:yes stop_codon:yes gene_type:complete